jgi:hypothetical protein
MLVTAFGNTERRELFMEAAMDETWRPVPGWEGLYEVSCFGGVRSLDRKVGNGWGAGRRSSGEYIKRGRVLAQRSDKDGYAGVRLQADGRMEHHRVHRLVCLAFHGRPPTESHVVAHGDGTKRNNIPSNLRWATQSENATERWEHERARKAA